MTYRDVTNVVKALIVARKGGMPIEELQRAYEDEEGNSIPFIKLGYNSLFHYLNDITEIKNKKNQFGERVLIIEDRKVSHLNALIGNQKPAKVQRRPRRERKGSFNNNYHFQNRNTFNFQQSNNSRSTGRYSPSISSGYKSCSTSFDEEEDLQRPTIFINPRKNNNYVHEPIYNRRQLIGDDFLLQLVIKNLKVPIWRKSEKSALYSGLCVSGQSIRQCIRRLENINSISEKVTIMLGAVDVYQGRTLEEMQADYKELLNLLEVKFNILRTDITICTIPPLANLSFMTDFERSSTFQMFNNWLRQTVLEYCDFDYNGVYCAFNLADFHEAFTTDAGGTNYNYFQTDARYVSGTRQTWVLFNGSGRQLALDLLS